MKGREGCPKATKIEKISKILDEDHDGKIRVADLTKVFHHCLAWYRILHFTLKYGVVWLWLRWLGVVWYAMPCRAVLCFVMLWYPVVYILYHITCYMKNDICDVMCGVVWCCVVWCGVMYSMVHNGYWYGVL